MTHFTKELIGLVPMAGQATRLSPLPGSKELLPLGFQQHPKGGRVSKGGKSLLVGGHAKSPDHQGDDGFTAG